MDLCEFKASLVYKGNFRSGLLHRETLSLMVEVTKGSHTTELHIIKGYLFTGDLQITVLDHSPLHEQGTGTESSSRKQESKSTLYSCFNSI